MNVDEMITTMNKLGVSMTGISHAEEVLAKARRKVRTGRRRKVRTGR